jgi:hypothetical protein
MCPVLHAVVVAVVVIAGIVGVAILARTGTQFSPARLSSCRQVMNLFVQQNPQFAS